TRSLRVPTPPISAPSPGYWTPVDLPCYRPGGTGPRDSFPSKAGAAPGEFHGGGSDQRRSRGARAGKRVGVGATAARRISRLLLGVIAFRRADPAVRRAHRQMLVQPLESITRSASHTSSLPRGSGSPVWIAWAPVAAI